MIQQDAINFNVASRVGVPSDKLAEALQWAADASKQIYEADVAMQSAVDGDQVKAKL